MEAMSMEPDDIVAARLDVAWYDGARHAMAAIGGGMNVNDLSRQIEARTAPAKKLLSENRCFERLRRDDSANSGEVKS
jgi:hypothetical protein